MDKRAFLKTGLMASCTMCFPAAFTGNNAPLPLLNASKGKFKKQAKYFIETPRGVKCHLCPQACVLKEGETGDCRTRYAEDNKMYTLAYGNPCAVHVDPIEKKPLNHFFPGSKSFSIATAGCNLACLNCQNWEISQASPVDTRNYDLPPHKVVEQCLAYGCKSIAYTYTDPVAFYEYTFDTAILARKSGLKNILITAGYINAEPLSEICKHIDAANVDLKSFSNETYEMLNAGTLEPVLNTLEILKDNNIWLEITNLVVPEWTDSLYMIKEMCEWLVKNGFQDYPLHFSRFHPKHRLNKLYPTPLSTLEQAYEIAKNEGLHHVYIGNVLNSFAENTICVSCNATVVNRSGYKVNEVGIINGKCKHCNENIAGVWQ